MIQLNIFYELGLINDPVYKQLIDLQENEILYIQNMEITKTDHGFYEISCNDFHECFSDVLKCYEKLNTSVSPIIGDLF